MAWPTANKNEVKEEIKIIHSGNICSVQKLSLLHPYYIYFSGHLIQNAEKKKHLLFLKCIMLATPEDVMLGTTFFYSEKNCEQKKKA
jgi:hypothetical protein